MELSSTNPDILLLDGECGMCTRLALFLEPRLVAPGRLRFVGQQSQEGLEAMGTLPPELHGLDTVVLLQDEAVHVRSTAILRTLLHLGWCWRVGARLVSIVPRFVRDPIYDLVARNRHRWFAPPDRCLFMPAETTRPDTPVDAEG
ncbi:MAG: DUF393 domain-containing protein [Myxococcota bacterium]|jgi:predicted DCC family thiol-disulfide oxidoreductase YuxK|nr:DUF393 domain-containing protein [Myxococcota bacterium]